jgi:hypothetical protein
MIKKFEKYGEPLWEEIGPTEFDEMVLRTNTSGEKQSLQINTKICKRIMDKVSEIREMSLYRRKIGPSYSEILMYNNPKSTIDLRKVCHESGIDKIKEVEPSGCVRIFFYLGLYLYVKYWIYLTDDDWYYIQMWDDLEYEHYRCDQMDGLMEFIENKMKPKIKKTDKFCAVIRRVQG